MQTDTTATARALADKAAVGLSLLCAIHCLFLPLAVSLLPVLSGLGLADEAFHVWMVVGVLPLSVFALFLGCRHHRHGGVLAMGIAGLVMLCTAVAFGHGLLGEAGERALTLAGAMVLAFSHVRNYRLCRTESCDCSH